MSLPGGFEPGRRHRLLLGVTPLDAYSGRQPATHLRFEIERALPHRPLPPNTPRCVPQSDSRLPRSLCRHDSGRFALLYQPGLEDRVDLRICDPGRLYVPRRLRVPLLSLTEIEAAEAAGAGAELARRTRAPLLFPGAAYPLPSKATGLRGRVLRDGAPMRWTLVEAVVPGSAPEDVLARARGDDRGEFLLLLPARAAAGAELPAAVRVRIEISGPDMPPVPSSPELPGLDPFWDLPREPWGAHDQPDPIAHGITLPPGYRRSAAPRELELILGRVLTGTEVDDFTFS